MSILQIIKKNYILIAVVALGILLGGYAIFRSREGFQNNKKATDTPAACAMIKLIFEAAQKNLKAAQDQQDETSIKNLEISVNNIQEEMRSMSCI